MNTEEIRRIAREVGDTYCCDYPDDWLFDDDQLERFVALILAAEREACAELCVKLAVGGGFAADCAEAIRARGQKCS